MITIFIHLYIYFSKDQEVIQKIRLVDVAIPFENCYQAFVEPCAEKVRKYVQLAEELRGHGYQSYDVTLDRLVVGALGAWEMKSEGVIKKLRISPRYANIMRRLTVSDRIRWSWELYIIQYKELEGSLRSRRCCRNKRVSDSGRSRSRNRRQVIWRMLDRCLKP